MITWEATLSVGRNGWPTGRPDEKRFISGRAHARIHSGSGPLTPLETEIGSDKGRNSARRFPSIEVVPADSELCKHTVRPGCRVRQDPGVRRSITPHSPQSYGGMFRRRRAAKFVAEVPVEGNKRETRWSARFI